MPRPSESIENAEAVGFAGFPQQEDVMTDGWTGGASDASRNPAAQAGGHAGQHSAIFGPAPNSADQVIDPVCGMTVDPRTAKHVAVHDGQQYSFCSVGCRTKFVAEPARYLARQKSQPVAVRDEIGRAHV